LGGGRFERVGDAMGIIVSAWAQKWCTVTYRAVVVLISLFTSIEKAEEPNWVYREGPWHGRIMPHTLLHTYQTLKFKCCHCHFHSSAYHLYL